MEEIIEILKKANKIWKDILKDWKMFDDYSDCYILFNKNKLILNCPMESDGWDGGDVVDLSFAIKKVKGKIGLTKLDAKSSNQRYQEFLNKWEKL